MSTHTHAHSPSSFIKHAADVASFYGFRPMRSIERVIPRAHRIHGAHSFVTTTQTCAASHEAQPQNPVLAFYATPHPSHLAVQHQPRETGEFGLHVVGSPESLGEILLLKTLCTILTEWGCAIERVRVNALGDRDSKLRFERELSAYLRKHALTLDPSCREALTKNPFEMYTCENETCRQILLDGPRSMNFLSEKSRAHFKEVLEHIEGLGLPYDIDDLLVGDEREQHIVFAIDIAEQDATVLGSTGGRFDEYMRRMTDKKEGSAVSASIFFRRNGAARSSFTITPNTQTPQIYFVQLGLRAKLQGLLVVDMLRHAHIPVTQSFDMTSLAPQLDRARVLGVPYLFIMGQREVLDGTIIVRSAKNSSQTTLALTALPRFLKTMRA